jgi:hypothetical protein
MRPTTMFGSAGCGEKYLRGELGSQAAGVKRNRDTTGGPAAIGPVKEPQPTTLTIFRCRQNQSTTAPAYHRPVMIVFGYPASGNTPTTTINGEAAFGASHEVTGSGNQPATFTHHKAMCWSMATGITCRRIAVSFMHRSNSMIRCTYSQTTSTGRGTRLSTPLLCC